MLVHIVAFKLLPGVSREDASVARAQEITRDHPAHIREIDGWAVGMNVTDRPVAYDFAVIAEFADRAALDAYMHHPDHQRGVAAWRAISTWIVVDLELEDGAPPGGPRAPFSRSRVTPRSHEHESDRR